MAVNELQQAVNQLENGGINSISSADIQSALRNQFPDIENSPAAANDAMFELQATISDLEEGGFNSIGNFELKDALSNQFPGLNNDPSPEATSARDALQQTIDQLANGGINSISNAEIQTALRNQFPGLDSSTTADDARSELNAAIDELNTGGINAIQSDDLRDALLEQFPQLGLSSLQTEITQKMGDAAQKLGTSRTVRQWDLTPPADSIEVNYSLESSTGQSTTQSFVLNINIDSDAQSVTGVTAQTNPANANEQAVDLTVTSDGSLTFSGSLATPPESLFLNYRDKSTNNDASGVLELSGGTDINAFIREFKLDGSTNTASQATESFQSAVFDATANTLTLTLNTGVSSDLTAPIADANGLTFADVTIDTSSELDTSSLSVGQLVAYGVVGGADANWSFTNVTKNESNQPVLPTGFPDADDTSGKKLYAASATSTISLRDRFIVTQTADEATRVQALQDQINALNTTLDGINSGELIPKTDLLAANPNLIDSDGKVDLTNLAAAMPNSGNELLKGADDPNVNEVAVQIGTNEVAIDKEELGELLAVKKETYKEALTAGFTSAEAGTAAQIKTIAAAKEFGVNLSADASDTEAKAAAESFDKVAQEFLKAGVTVADVLESGDTELIEQTKQLVSDPNAAAAAAAAREKLDNYVSPFGGVATVTALDIIKLATKAGRALDGGTTITDVDVLGTDDLSETNAAFIGALDGTIQGAEGEGLKFSADSKAMVFKFELKGATQASKTISYLASGEDIYLKDGAGNYIKDAAGNNQLIEAAQSENAGFGPDADGNAKYDKYLKYVSHYDLLQYGATETGDKDEQGNMLFSWDLAATEVDPANAGQIRSKVRTADGAALTTLTGQVIDRAGWYDFTQQGGSGDGARYIENDAGRIVGVELNFTANKFGDKAPDDDFITDPGATVGTETIGSAPTPTAAAATLEQRLEVQTETQTQLPLQNQIVRETPNIVSNAQPQDPRLTGTGIGLDAFYGDDIGVDDSGDGIAAMNIGSGVGPGEALQSTSSGQGDGEMSLSQALNTFLGEGEGQGTSDTQGQAKGQGAEGQGAGTGGDAALGEDQSPDTQRKRGLLLQPMMKAAEQAQEAASSSKLLKNLSEGTLLGTNLLDALALGAGVLYALYAPKAVETSRKGLRGLVDRFRNQVTGGGVKIPEKQVLSVFAMRMANGSERLVAAKVGMGTMEVVAQQDLPADAGVNKPGSQTQVDYAVKQLVNKLGERTSDVLLIGPQLSNQRSLLENIAGETRNLETSSLVERIKQCSSEEISQLRAWLDKPSSTPPESSPVYQQMMGRMESYGGVFSQEQASMASLIELSIALGWSGSEAG
ncbi:hypothetical protein [Synechococcus sp. MIT S9452]|uniref:hypothetical protein n=1 Tax=Synechococcus sp. MIT S9452 TaxID=3082546 RepID=UPI0039A5BBAB